MAGSITFPLADYDIVAPNVGGFIISIADDGAVEFAVNFTKASETTRTNPTRWLRGQLLSAPQRGAEARRYFV